MENHLIQSVIRAVAKYGIENTTVKKISQEAHVTASSIYAYYIDKDDLLNASFLWVDEFFSFSIQRLCWRNQSRDALRRTWKMCFRFLTEHPDETLFYVRFLYSTMYTEELREQHNANFSKCSPLHEAFGERRAFLFNHVLMNTFCYAQQYITGQLPHSETTIEQIWNTISDAAERCFMSTPVVPLRVSGGYYG